MSSQVIAGGVSIVVVAVDVGKNSAALSVTGEGRRCLLVPVEFQMTEPALVKVLSRIRQVLPDGVRVKVGVEAAGHYHLPLIGPSIWPAEWEVLELNPAHVSGQRRIQGRRRIKTDAIDLEAITELVFAGRGFPVQMGELSVVELAAWSSHRMRRVLTRTATKNQLLSQLDRCFPGLTLALPDVLERKPAGSLRGTSLIRTGWLRWERTDSSGSLNIRS